MLTKTINFFTTKTTPAPIKQPTIRDRVSKVVQECFIKIRAFFACLCCIRPMQKKVVVQPSKISQIAGRALRFACAHKHKLIAAAIVGAAGATAYTLIARAPIQETVPQKAVDQVSLSSQKSLGGLVSNYFLHIVSGGLAIVAANWLRDRTCRSQEKKVEETVKAPLLPSPEDANQQAADTASPSLTIDQPPEYPTKEELDGIIRPLLPPGWRLGGATFPTEWKPCSPIDWKPWEEAVKN